MHAPFKVLASFHRTAQHTHTHWCVGYTIEVISSAISVTFLIYFIMTASDAPTWQCGATFIPIDLALTKQADLYKTSQLNNTAQQIRYEAAFCACLCLLFLHPAAREGLTVHVLSFYFSFSFLICVCASANPLSLSRFLSHVRTTFCSLLYSDRNTS